MLVLPLAHTAKDHLVSFNCVASGPLRQCIHLLLQRLRSVLHLARLRHFLRLKDVVVVHDSDVLRFTLPTIARFLLVASLLVTNGLLRVFFI